MTTKQDAMEAAKEAVTSTADVRHIDFDGYDSETWLENPEEVARASVRAYLAAMDEAGFVMVPVEPSEAMMEEGLVQFPTLRDIWQGMLAARPTNGDS